MSTEKLNFNKSNVDFYWKNQDPRLSRILSIMENVEHWVVDDVEPVARELMSMGKMLSEVSKKGLTKNSEQVIFIMAYISSSRALRLMSWLDENYPGLSFHYVMEARQIDGWEAGRLLLDRLKTLKTLNLLGKIFAPSRTRLIAELLQSHKDD